MGGFFFDFEAVRTIATRDPHAGGGGDDPFESMFGGSGFGGMPGGIRIQMGGGPGGPQVFSSFGGPQRRRAPPVVKRYDVLQPNTKVVLKDLVSKPELNNEMASVQSYDDSKGRYQVKLDDDGDVLSLKPQNLQQILRGVRLTDIKSSPELDGKSGNLLGARRSATGDERYVVALSSVRQTVAVKSENLILPAHLCLEPTPAVPCVDATLRQRLERVERVFLLDCLHKNRGNRTRTARELGVARRTLLYRLARLNIPCGDVAGSAE